MALPAEDQIRLWPVAPPVRVPPDMACPRVEVSAQAWRRVTGHAAQDLGREAGGVLVGQVRVDGAEICLVVEGSLPAEAAVGGPIHLTFTHGAWQQIRERHAADYPHTLILGWYHSHPGLGVFLSGADRDLHEQIFGWQRWCVALVVDPLRQEHAFFWPGPGAISRCPETLLD